jgi:hypothetical protein
MDKVEPALTADDWAGGVYWDYSATRRPAASDDTPHVELTGDDARRAVIALANAELPADDPRKITRDWVGLLGTAQKEARIAAPVYCSNSEGGQPCPECQAALDTFCARLRGMADALAAYLPPDRA